ncbi:M48 family metalloprotease [Thermodesulfobacteriota bacterium]
MKTNINKYVKTVTFLMLFSFLFSQLLIPSSWAAFLSTDEEKIIGREFLFNITKVYEIVDDDYANDYINRLGKYLLLPLESRRFPYRFYIIKQPTLNAFAAPGGNIFIFSGLIDVMNEVDELAAVLTHEIAHVSARHLARRMELGKKLGWATLAGVLAAVLVGGKATGAVMTGTLAASQAAQLHYSRDDERQSDQLGFKYMKATGFDPSGMISVLQKMQRGQGYGTSNFPSYLLTHPTGPERMSNLDMMISSHSFARDNRVAERFRRQFPIFKTILRAKYTQVDQAERYFRKELEKNPASPSANFGLGMVYQQLSEYDQAIDHYKRALKQQPESELILANLGEAYQLNGQEDEALRVLQKALRLDEQNKGVLFLMAGSYQQMGDYKKAIRLYERLLAMRPVKNEVFYNLGVSHGRVQQLAYAHYYFGIYFLRSHKFNKAKFHFEKADSLVKNDDRLRKKIHKAIDAPPFKKPASK